MSKKIIETYHCFHVTISIPVVNCHWTQCIASWHKLCVQTNVVFIQDDFPIWQTFILTLSHLQLATVRCNLSFSRYSLFFLIYSLPLSLKSTGRVGWHPPLFWKSAEQTLWRRGRNVTEFKCWSVILDAWYYISERAKPYTFPIIWKSTDFTGFWRVL